MELASSLPAGAVRDSLADRIAADPVRAEKMMTVAQALEASFLSEMLKSAGIGETPSDFGGGAGEDQFASFLREEQATQMTRAGGIGLAQSLFNAMMARSHD